MTNSSNINNTTLKTTRKTITVTEKQDYWIKQRIAAGDFTNDSEYIRDLIRQDQAKKAESEAVRQALIEGEKSGEAQPFNLVEFEKEMTAKYGQS